MYVFIVKNNNLWLIIEKWLRKISSPLPSKICSSPNILHLISVHWKELEIMTNPEEMSFLRGQILVSKYISY